MSLPSMVGEPRSRRVRRVLEALLGTPVLEGNRVEILRNGVEIFPAMLEAIESATSTIDLVTFVYWKGDIAVRFAEALSERARSGVRVRVLLDAVGARKMREELIHRMEDGGVVVEWFREPVRRRPGAVNHRTHRKVMVCDERVGFTGGVGIAEEWEGDARDPGEWRDTHVRVEGPAVDGLRAAFLGNWIETGRPLFDDRDRFPEPPKAGESPVMVVRGAAQVGPTDIATLLRTLVDLATRRIRIATAYFNPDETFLRLMQEAAERGVKVDVLLPGRHIDKRVCKVASEREFAPLLEAGVRIWRYQPTMMHAKIVTVDGLAAAVGSANLNRRSMSLDEEVSLAVLDPEVVGTLDRHFEEDLERSRRVDAAAFRHRGPLRRAREAVVGLLEPYL